MELDKEMFIRILEKKTIQVTFPNLGQNVDRLIEMSSYSALKKIKAIIQNDRLSDEECFLKIEEIICVFEELGSSCGGRHDFG